MKRETFCLFIYFKLSFQLIFEGDALTLRCRTPRVSTSEIHELPEDSYAHSHVFWGWSETIITPDSNQDIVFHDPQVKFSSITTDKKVYAESGLVDTILRIPYTTRNHSGTWDCRLKSNHEGELSQSVTVLVISNKTQYCMPEITKSNKGAYSWPKTIRGRTVNLPCQYETQDIYATHTCGPNGQWENLNVTKCPYVMETTRLLEQFSTVNLSLAPGSIVESANQLSNYTANNILFGHFIDPMDVVFLTKTVENYLDFVINNHELGNILLDIVTHVTHLNRQILHKSQSYNMSCSRLVSVVEQIGIQKPGERQSTSGDIEMFSIPSDNFNGVTCTWLKEKGLFQCMTPNNYHNLPFNERSEASIQLPTMTLHTPNENILITAYKNSNLFPDNKTNFAITSAVIGVKFKNLLTLSESIFVMLRGKPFHNEKSAPRPVLWDQELGTWTNTGCTTIKIMGNVVIFNCSRLGYYGLIQNVNFLNDFDDERAGKKFRLSPPGFYVGGLILFLCLWINITTYAVAGKQIQMPKRLKHALINTWAALSALVFTFTLGIYQTENYDICQLFGIVLHYLCISVLLWICVTFNQFYKRLARRTDDIRSKEGNPISGLYFVGWGIGLLLCGLSGAINMEEYATYHYCFMRPIPSISAIFVPTIILLIFILISVARIKYTLRNREISANMSEGTQMTEQVDLETIDGRPAQIMNRSISMSTRTTGTQWDDHEHSLRAQVKSHLIVLVLVFGTFTCAAIAVSRPFSDHILYEEEIFSGIYAMLAMILGLFILFFFGISRNDVRQIWSTVNCGSYKTYRGYTCRPTNVINFKEFRENPSTITPAAPSVVYQSNISRSNSQSSKNRPGSANGNHLTFMHRLNSVGTMRTDLTTPPPADIFYNPTQSHVARKFFRKQKRLQKQTNLEIQRRMDDGESSVYGPTRLYGTGNKINNTNIHMDGKSISDSFDKQFNSSFETTTSELLMSVTSDGLRLTPKESIYASVEEQDIGTLKIDDKYKRPTLLDIVEEDSCPSKGRESPIYVNSPMHQNQIPTMLELEPQKSSEDNNLILTLNSPFSAMNTVGLPLLKNNSNNFYKSNSTIKSNDSLNTVRVALTKDEAYVSAVMEITDQITIKDGSMRIFEQRDNKCKSLTELIATRPTTLLTDEERIKSISCADILEGSIGTVLNQSPLQESPQSPQLVPPNMCDIESPTTTNTTTHLTPPQTIADRRKPISFEDQEFFNQSLLEPSNVATSSPAISVSELGQYQNSELSLQSQEFYAPPDNDLNIILASNLNFQLSEDEDDDEDEEDIANCSRDYLLDNSDALNESGSIDELYQQIKKNTWRRDEDDFLNENDESESEESSMIVPRQNQQHHQQQLTHSNTPLDVINDN